MRMLIHICLLLLVFLFPLATMAWGQMQPPSNNPQSPQPTGLGRGSADTPLYFASSAAATRAIAICSGLWSGNQTIEDIDAYSPLRAEDAKTFKTDIDYDKKTVAIRYDEDLPPRYVVWRPVLGCTQLPVGATIESAKYLPQVSEKVRPPDLDRLRWPMGDADAEGKLSKTKQEKLNTIMTAAFDGKTYGGKTWGVVIVKDGKIIAEKYGLNYDKHKGGQTHSAAKGFASTVVGIAVKQYGLDMNKPGILLTWQRPGDPRSQITIEHLIHMTSGLYGEGNGSPQADIYSNGASVEDRAATNILHTMPGKRFLYNPPDTMLMLRAVRETVNDDTKFWAMPFTELFWKIGMTRTTPSGDWNGDFLMSGQTYSTARDFARFGLLYLNGGKWQGEQLIPQNWVEFVSTPGPGQPNEGGRKFGAHFWLLGGSFGMPQDAYTAIGGQGHFLLILPSKNMVIVRRGMDGRAFFNIAKFTTDILGVLH